MLRNVNPEQPAEAALKGRAHVTCLRLLDVPNCRTTPDRRRQIFGGVWVCRQRDPSLARAPEQRLLPSRFPAQPCLLTPRQRPTKHALLKCPADRSPADSSSPRTTPTSAPLKFLLASDIAGLYLRTTSYLGGSSTHHGIGSEAVLSRGEGPQAGHGRGPGAPRQGARGHGRRRGGQAAREYTRRRGVQAPRRDTIHEEEAPGKHGRRPATPPRPK